MSLKKSLTITKSKKAQASLEYFILLAVIGGLTLIASSAFLRQTNDTSRNLFTTAVGRILR